MQRTVLQSTADAQAAEKSKKKGAGGGLDSVLSTIKGPKAVSTVLKSSMDWDVYKEKEGLEEDLQAAAKDGYVAHSFMHTMFHRKLSKWIIVYSSSIYLLLYDI